MALRYARGTSTAPPESLIQLDIIGDGTGTTLTVALDVPPLNLDLKGNLPVDVAHVSSTTPLTVTLGTDRKSVVLTFSSPPPAPPNDQTISFVLVFAGA